MPDENESTSTLDETLKEPAARERGPAGWLLPILESAYTRLIPREVYEQEIAARGPSIAAADVESTPRPTLSDAPQNLWQDRLAEYKRRKLTAAVAEGPAIAGPMVPGAKNWAPLGPSVVMEGQARGFPPVAGRVSGIAVAPGGRIVYAATANGGVFKSVDGGISWNSCMDAFDVDPTSFASTSLACGAIAIDPNDPQRVYVGTGEGDTHAIFANRITNALPAYRGIGPIRSDDGGQTWITENVAPGSPPLAGKAFFALAVDPTDRENVMGTTSEGVYQRVTKPDGSVEWAQRRSGVHSSVVAVSSTSGTRFYCAEWGGGVFQSTNGVNYKRSGTDFPTTNVGRIALGVQPANPDLVYAFVVDKLGALLGIYRLNGSTSAWKRISNPPDVLPTESGEGQGDYDVAIAVDPTDANIIYIGGSYFADNNVWPASIWRCTVKRSAGAYKMTASSIGAHAHADVHVLVHSPGDPDELWTGCDGGVFLNRHPRATGKFLARNHGLSCLCTNYFAQHPEDPGIIFCGLQDNGTARASGGSIWKHVGWGDGGYCLVNWAEPDQVLTFANGTVFRSTNGGVDHNSWESREFPWAMMTEPIVGPPYNPANPDEARIVALAAGTTIHFSDDFGISFDEEVSVQADGGIFAATFASAKHLFVGTVRGEVFRLDKTGSSWDVERLDDVSASPLGLHGIISDIAIDWTDTSLRSIYVAFGGIGDYRHVWHFNGTRWKARSGPAGDSNNLLDVEHNAIAVDRTSPDNVYVGADIGVWHSPDRGATWTPMPNGLPDAPIFDLQIHPTRKLLRASTHGRGLYEFPL
jgi:hypothetical protein